MQREAEKEKMIGWTSGERRWREMESLAAAHPDFHGARLLFGLFFPPDPLRREIHLIKQFKEWSRRNRRSSSSSSRQWKDYSNICRARLSAAQGCCCDSSIIINSGVCDVQPCSVPSYVFKNGVKQRFSLQILLGYFIIKKKKGHLFNIPAPILLNTIISYYRSFLKIKQYSVSPLQCYIVKYRNRVAVVAVIWFGVLTDDCFP